MLASSKIGILCISIVVAAPACALVLGDFDPATTGGTGGVGVTSAIASNGATTATGNGGGAVSGTGGAVSGTGGAVSGTGGTTPSVASATSGGSVCNPPCAASTIPCTVRECIL